VTTRDLILMGPPGSGKGTQARLLVESGDWVQLATGDLFREHMSRGTELGRLAEGILARGEYVPDDVTVGMVRERLREIPARTRIIFDGFPRTVAQAEALDDLLRENGRSVGNVVLIDVSRQELIDRISKRKHDSARSDDTPEVVGKRLEVYEQRTRPVVEHYARKGLLRRVNGSGAIDEIHARLNEALSPEAVNG
jgi:adenylate kinase